MLTALQLGNFKSWREVNAPLAPITGFFGTNSSGKTSLLQALLLMKQTTENSDRGQVLHFGSADRDLVELRSFEDIVYLNDSNLDLSLGLQWEDKQNYELFQSIFFGVRIEYFNFLLYIKKQFYVFKKDNFQMEAQIPDLSNFDDTISKLIQIRSASRKFHRFDSDDLLNSIKISRGLQDVESNLEDQLEKVNYLGPLRAFPQPNYTWSGAAPSNVGKQGENTIAALLAARVGGNKVGDTPLEEYIALQLKQLGLIDSFRLEELREGTNIFRVLVRKTPESPEVSLTDVGFGVSQVLPVLVLCYYVPEGSTVILEQPELHLHPSVQSGLADVFIDAYQKRGVQIIIESHSEHLLRRLQRRIAEEKIATTDVNLYFCSLEHGESKLEPLELDEYGNIHNYPKDFFGDRFEEMAAMTEAGIARREKRALEAQ